MPDPVISVTAGPVKELAPGVRAPRCHCVMEVSLQSLLEWSPISILFFSALTESNFIWVY